MNSFPSTRSECPSPTSAKTRHSNYRPDHNANPRTRGRSPGNIGPTSARPFFLPPVVSFLSHATAHLSGCRPRHTRRASGGPSLLHGFPPAPRNPSFSGNDPLQTSAYVRGQPIVANTLLFYIIILIAHG